MKHKLLAVIGILAILLGLLPGSAFAATPMTAQVVVPIPGPDLDIYQVTVNDGPGGQTDPHVSGDWASYTDNSVYGIRFQNLDMGIPSDRLIPHADGVYDSLSDINSGKIVFMLATDPGSQGIYLAPIDMFGNPGPTVELSPSETALRRRSAIGGDTIAYEDRGYDPSASAQQEIALSSVLDPAAPAYRLTNDMLSDQWPAVSPDGNAVVWVKCASTTTTECDVWRVERMNGAWGIPEQMTSADGAELLPDTNGPVTVYNSTAGGDYDIRWLVKDASGTYVESVLALPGIQRNPNIAGDLISFESSPAVGSPYDIWLYDLGTNRLYQLTDTSISESLSDVTISDPSGIVRVVWAQPKQIYPYDMDVYAMSFLLPDLTPPSITPTVSGTLGANGWYTSDVSLTWYLSDPESVISSTSGCEAVSIIQDQAATDYTCSATSAGGTSSASATIKRDGTKPVTSVTNVTEGATYTLGSVPQAGCSSTDNLSGIAAEATLTLTGGEAQGTGSFTATCSGALDVAGNAADPAVVHYTVNNPSTTYNFTGFTSPVDNPSVMNTAKAGQTIPLKWRITDANGNPVTNLTGVSVTAVSLSCPSAPTTDAVEEYATSNSGLQNLGDGYYQWNWKSPSTYANTCKTLKLDLGEGAGFEHLALFQFRK